MMVDALPPCRLSKWLQRFGVMVRMKLAWAGSARDAVWPWLAAVAAVAGLAESKRTFVRIDQPWFHRLAWAKSSRGDGAGWLAYLGVGSFEIETTGVHVYQFFELG